MIKPFLPLAIAIFSILLCTRLCFGVDSSNLQDTCPAADFNKHEQTIFINGLPCKNPANITASDFKSSLINQPGDTDNFFRSSVTLVTAFEFSGLNTLGLSVARTDLEVDGLVLPHSHPRASEIAYVSSGIVFAGFVDTNNQLFQTFLREGDVFVFPRGLLHYCLNAGFEQATVFSVLNSQNPGVVSIADAMFAADDTTAINVLARRLISFSNLEVERVRNVTFFQF